jgi:hypothetical protein
VHHQKERTPLKYAIPIYPIIEIQDAAQAEQLRAKLEYLLNQPQIKMLLMSQGVPGIVSTTVGPPYLVDERAMAAQQGQQPPQMPQQVAPRRR